MSIQDEVLEYINQHGIKKKYFADQIDVTPIMLSHWFNGRVQFNRNKLDSIKTFISTK